jgi:hypothetical protein
MKQPKVITHLVVHHSASHPDTTPKEIEKWHKERGFNSIGYHKIITADGIIHDGRPESEVPASVKGHNKGTLAVCLTGSFNRDTPTTFQLISLELLLGEWKIKHPTAKIVAHRDLAPTICCGDNLYAWLKSKYPV